MGIRGNHDEAVTATVEDDAKPGRGMRPRTSAETPSFFSVADAARMLGISEATLYRAVADGQFPAARIRDRVIIPAKALEALSDSAINHAVAADSIGIAGSAR
jgi:excisionase family DNA binding protein